MKIITATGMTSVIMAAVLATGCASTPKPDPETSALRNQLAELQGNPQIGPFAPTAFADADRALVAAEKSAKDKGSKKGKANFEQLTYLANSKIEIAKAQAEQRASEEKIKTLSEKRTQVLLDSRAQEASAARASALSARADADAARADAEAARAQAEKLRQQITELNAKQTERGLVVTLGDVLFATGKADLKAGATANLGKLVSFLSQYPERTVIVEGHTDSTGSDATNQALSQRRADAVKTYLTSAGIDGSRVESIGKSSSMPVADNSTAAGRQQNRRVEIVISNE